MKASAQQDIPPAVFLGFCAKEYWAPAPDWWNATWTAHIQEVCSAGACLSKRPPAWVDRWDFNRASCWNDEAAAIACVPDELRDAFRVYAYRAMPLIFGGDALPRHLAVDQLFFSDLPPLPPEPALPEYQRLGYDVVQYAHYLGYGCSPLSCNGMGAQQPVNAYCLLDTLAVAYTTAEVFACDEPEPGPYIIFEILRRR
jgi:hypothetical protein